MRKLKNTIISNLYIEIIPNVKYESTLEDRKKLCKNYYTIEENDFEE